MREKIAELIELAIEQYRTGGGLSANIISKVIANAILSLPSGYIAGEHELTVEEMTDKMDKWLNGIKKAKDILEQPADKLWHSINIEKVRNILEKVLTFNGHRITKPIPSSEGK